MCLHNTFHPKLCKRVPEAVVERQWSSRIFWWKQIWSWVAPIMDWQLPTCSNVQREIHKTHCKLGNWGERGGEQFTCAWVGWIFQPNFYKIIFLVVKFGLEQNECSWASTFPTRHHRLSMTGTREKRQQIRVLLGWVDCNLDYHKILNKFSLHIFSDGIHGWQTNLEESWNLLDARSKDNHNDRTICAAINREHQKGPDAIPIRE